MSRAHSGNFSAKHPEGTKVDEAIMQEVEKMMTDGSMACKTAHAIAGNLGVPPAQVGVAIDLHNGRIKACQLGLFGYGKVKAIAQAGPELAHGLKEALNQAMMNNHLSCAKAWAIAQSENVTRLEVGRACETLGIKINQCQIGAF